MNRHQVRAAQARERRNAARERKAAGAERKHVGAALPPVDVMRVLVDVGDLVASVLPLPLYDADPREAIRNDYIRGMVLADVLADIREPEIKLDDAALRAELVSLAAHVVQWVRVVDARAEASG